MRIEDRTSAMCKKKNNTQTLYNVSVFCLWLIICFCYINFSSIFFHYFLLYFVLYLLIHSLKSFYFLQLHVTVRVLVEPQIIFFFICTCFCLMVFCFGLKNRFQKRLHYVTLFFDISTWTLTTVLWYTTICQIFLLWFGLFILFSIQLQWYGARFFHIQQFLCATMKMIKKRRKKEKNTKDKNLDFVFFYFLFSLSYSSACIECIIHIAANKLIRADERTRAPQWQTKH